MGYIVRMPKLGLEMEEGTVLEWTVDEGGEVTEGEQIAEIESEKSVGGVEAREDGVLRRMYLQVDDTVPPSTPMGIVAAPDADISDLEAEAEAALEADDSELAEETESATAANDTAGAGASAGGGGAAADSADVKASPRAEKRAEELGVDLTTVDGTGPQGAVTADDVEAAAEEREAADTGAAAEGDTGVRRVGPDDVAAHRYERATAVADGAAATALFETAEAVRSAFEESVTMTDVLAVVALVALPDHPTVNATYSEGTHHLQESRNLALAVDVEGDRTAGVIPAAGELSVTELVAARQELAGGDREAVPTFTLANAAETDTEGLLVTEPAVAALAVDPTGQRAVPTDDGVDLRPLVTASLTYDTRALDVADAREFLATFLDRAEDASALVLGSYRGGE
ncbi:hypothetical protein BRD09_03355 [Halobacteriales archaeon SW_10_68_16]|nr:MAG: hypothetical protein BRD09_03355 [Halobacteriales archaeon SW_10_68_16]